MKEIVDFEKPNELLIMIKKHENKIKTFGRNIDKRLEKFNEKKKEVLLHEDSSLKAFKSIKTDDIYNNTVSYSNKKSKNRHL